MLRAAALVALATVTVALCVLAPLRQLSGDTVPARVGGLVLRCSHSFDLSRVDWMFAQNQHDNVYYFEVHDHAGDYSSVFGPAPAVVSSLALLDVGEGATITDDVLRRRERATAALLLALSAIVLAIACRARTSWPRAIVTAGIAVLSFAGAATLGQALWQATVALPALVGGLALVAWADRYPRLALAAPALLAVAAMIRPNTAPLGVGIAVMWALPALRDRRRWLIAIVIAVVAVAPFVVYNAIHFNSPLPLGQWAANKRDVGAAHVFGLRPFLRGISGLFASPSRGIVWFAPLAVAGALRSPRPLAIALVAQLVVMAAFFKWHGGQAFGPRLLTEATWIALYGACTLRVRWLAPLAAITIVVGQLGLWLYHPEQWEARRRPEAHTRAFWDVGDNAIFATLRTPDPSIDASDSPPRTVYSCRQGRVYTR